MRAITQPVRLRKPTNCDGPEEWFTEQDFVVEEDDVGRAKENYLGHRHATHRFSRRDVGATLRVTSQGSYYECWGFLLPHVGGS